MRKVRIKASREYDVLIDKGILITAGEKLVSLGKIKKVCIVTDSNVAPLYEGKVRESIETAGIDCVTFVIPAGEGSKNGVKFIELLNYLADNKLSRTDAIVALGGGVVGDLAGFAASAYLRGIRFVQIPTTLLAAVDSSVGGKTAIDLNAGKNLAGTFYQPSMVICDTETFASLPDNIFADGCAEVIKYGGICDRELFDALDSKDIREQLEDVVARCVEIKAEIVCEDEFDTGRRQLLNFGHTSAHAIEALSHFEVSHGSAVAIGMALITRAAAAMGICDESCTGRIEGILKKYSLPISTPYTAKQLADIAKSDKKIASGTINFVVPRRIGDCYLHNVDTADIESIFERGLA